MENMWTFLHLLLHCCKILVYSTYLLIILIKQLFELLNVMSIFVPEFHVKLSLDLRDSMAGKDGRRNTMTASVHITDIEQVMS